MYDPNNIFAKIIRGEIPSRKIFENEHALSFWDIRPVSTLHALVVPKGNYVELYDFVSRATDAEQRGFWEVFRETAGRLGLTENFNTLTNSVKPPFFVQSVPHFHLHLIGGERLVNPAEW